MKTKEECFFADGLNFSCKRCSACCRYDSGFVFLNEDDLEKLTSETKMDRESFIKTYCRWVPGMQDTRVSGGELLSLKEKSNNDCIFWNLNCTVYSARPLQCTTFPFWENILSSKYNWQIAASGCPGINSGEIHSCSEIKQCLESIAQKPAIERQESHSA